MVATRDIQEKPIKVISLFSGCGGMDLGFEGGFETLNVSINDKIHPDWIEDYVDDKTVRLKRNRFTTVFANDIRPDALSAWSRYFSMKGDDVSVFKLGSIVDYVNAHKSGETTVFPEEIDVVIGGFPCQDFSNAGKRMGFDSKVSHDGKKIENDSEENRGKLYLWMKEVVSTTQPKMFIAENVKGLTNLGDAKTIIENDFSSACDGGYLVLPAKVINAADYGVPQHRERVIFFGFKKSELTDEALNELSAKNVSDDWSPYPVITHAEPSQCKGTDLIPYVTAQDCLSDLPEPDASLSRDQQMYSHAKYLHNGSQGQTEINLDGICPTIRSQHHGNIEFRRLSEEHGGKHESELKNGLKERRLTIRECARIQTFPDSYQFIAPSIISGGKNVSSTDAYVLIGNAVPPVMAYSIARKIQDNWVAYFGS